MYENEPEFETEPKPAENISADGLEILLTLIFPKQSAVITDSRINEQDVCCITIKIMNGHTKLWSQK